MIDPIFFISTGRTGTKFFSRFFSEHFDSVSSYHTTKHTEIINILGNMRTFNCIPESFVRTIWKIKYNNISSHDKKYIECNPYYWNMLDIISKDIPSAKFIFVVRSPKSFIMSFTKKEKQNIRSKIANGLIPFWQPLSYLDQLKLFTNNYYQRVEYYAKTWNIKNKSFIEFSSKSNNSRLFKFEDIFSENTDLNFIHNIIDWLQLKPNKKIREDAFKTKVNQNKFDINVKWDKNCEQIVEKTCGNLMKKFNYYL